MTREQRHQKSAFVFCNLKTASPNGLGQLIPPAFLIGLAIHLFIFGIVFSLLFPTGHTTAFIWSLITGPIVWVIVQFMIRPLIKRIISVKPVSCVTHISYRRLSDSWAARYPKVGQAHSLPMPNGGLRTRPTDHEKSWGNLRFLDIRKATSRYVADQRKTSRVIGDLRKLRKGG